MFGVSLPKIGGSTQVPTKANPKNTIEPAMMPGAKNPARVKGAILSGFIIVYDIYVWKDLVVLNVTSITAW